MRVLLLVAWFAFMASAHLWVPAYEGDLGGEDSFVPVYALIAFLAGAGVRERARSARAALLSTRPTIGLLAAAAVAGVLLKDAGAEYRGSPLYLYVGVALLVSWAVLVPATALVSRTRWNGGMGIGVGLMVAGLGLVMFTAQID